MTDAARFRRNDDIWDGMTRMRPQLIRLAMARGVNPADAEDCVHEAFARTAAFESLDPERLDAFLTSLVVRLAVDSLRRQSRDRRTAVKVGGLAPCEPTFEESVCDSSESAWVAGEVQRQLRVREQTLLQMLYDGASLSEAAAHLQLTFKAAQRILERIRVKARVVQRVGAAGLLPLPWLRLLRKCRRPGLAVSAIAGLSLTMTVLQVPFGAPAHSKVPTVASTRPAVLLRHVSTTSPVARKTSAQVKSERVARPTGVARLAASRSHPPSYELVPPVRTPAAGTPRVGTRSKYPNEGLVASTKRCLRNGFAPLSYEVLCRG
ncbi:MAG: sigma-70 family RNA polymerase sigma factor [Actinomycetes bacterium]